MAGYWTLPGFEGLYLEDSWVLSIRPGEATLTLEVDFVLRESHPEYRAPLSGEQYCYRRGRIRFERVTAMSWTRGRAAPATDATGEQDLGSFDEFEVADEVYTIAGDFGTIEVVSERPTAELLE